MLKIQSVRLSRNLNYYTQYNLTVEPADQLRGAGKNPAAQLTQWSWRKLSIYEATSE